MVKLRVESVSAPSGEIRGELVLYLEALPAELAPNIVEIIAATFGRRPSLRVLFVTTCRSDGQVDMEVNVPVQSNGAYGWPTAGHLLGAVEVLLSNANVSGGFVEA